MLVLLFIRSAVSDSVTPWQTARLRGILQARILEWVVIPFSRDLPDPGMIKPASPGWQVDSLHWATWEALSLISASHYTLSPPLLVIPFLFSHSFISDSLQPHGQQHAKLPCPSSSPGACSNSCPASRWCHSTISSSVVPFSSCLGSFPASGSSPMSRLFT